jgi:import inner membrane translocase subunit TIM50
MLMTRAFTRALPVRVAHPLRALPRALPAVSITQFIRQKSNRHRPAFPSGQTNPNPRPNPRDLQNNANNRAGRTVGSPLAESQRQDQLSKETAEFDTAARPERNEASDLQPGPGLPRDKEGSAEFVPGQEEPQPEEEPIARKPLPDLRHGIPSTFAEEFLNQKARPDETGAKAHHDINITDDPYQSTAGGPGEGSGREEGELPKSAYKTSIDKRRERMATWMYIAFSMFGVTGAVFLGRNWETEEEERTHQIDAPSGWGFKLFWDRVKARVSGQMGYYTEPTFPKLLPDMDPAPPYTLVLSLEDLMVHSEWTREHGWRTAKRPGIDYFLGYLSQYYELVLFTSLPVSAADQIVRKLDPFHFMAFPLFREATRYEKGQYVKVCIYESTSVTYTKAKSCHRISPISTDLCPRSFY